MSKNFHHDPRSPWSGAQVPTKGMQLSLIDLDHLLPGKDLVTRAKRVQLSTEFELFEPIVNCTFCSDPDVSKKFGNASPRNARGSKILTDIRETSIIHKKIFNLVNNHIEMCSGEKINLCPITCMVPLRNLNFLQHTFLLSN